jgi:hypothetical protein
MHTTLERPFYFICVLWGERFREYFVEYCLPSLLAPGNLPALSTRSPSKLLIATLPEDWAALEATAVFQAVARYLTPVFIEIPPCPPDRSGCQHMGIGHRLACDMASRDKAYGAVLTPDSMLSDGSIARLQELAQTGIELVLTAALRFGEEPFLAHLRTLGVLPTGSRSKSGAALTISGRQMVHAAVNGFHSETLAYEWDAPGVLAVVPAAWWRVPGEDGILLHSLSWAPLLLDYGAVKDHDTSTFDEWTLDGDYVFRNVGGMERIHVVQDSDEMFLASWGPLDERPVKRLKVPFGSKLLSGLFFRQSFRSGIFDPLKRRIFFLPVRWHAKPLNRKWTAAEARAARQLDRWVRPDEPLSPPAASVPTMWIGLALALVKLREISGSLLMFFAYFWFFRKRAAIMLGRILRGDREAMRRTTWILRSLIFKKAASLPAAGDGKR